MKTPAVVLLVVALAACGGDEPAGSSRGSPLIGTWEQVGASAVEGTVRLTFRENGTFELFVDAFGSSITTTGTYRVDGNHLRLDAQRSTVVDDDGDELVITAEELVEGDLSGTYVIEGDSLFITFTEDGEETVAEYRRT